MGIVDESSLNPEFYKALLGLKAGAVSPVTRVGGSFVLLKRTTDADGIADAAFLAAASRFTAAALLARRALCDLGKVREGHQRV